MKKIFYLDDLKEFFYRGFDANLFFENDAYYLVRADEWPDKKPILKLYQEDYFCYADDSVYLSNLNEELKRFRFNFLFY